MRSRFIVPVLVIASIACSPATPAPELAPVRAPVKQRVVRETVTVRDPELEKRVARLELRLLERDAQVLDLETRLEDARAEVVRAMAKVQSVASRAEAASGMAEAEVALQSLRVGAGQPPAEVTQLTRLVRQSSTEFDKHNYGGALYLANQAKALAAAFRGRTTQSLRNGTRPGETAFALPIRLKAASRGNVREGPGTTFAVAFAVDPGASLVGLGYTDEWVRISDDSGRSGWIFRSLVERP